MERIPANIVIVGSGIAGLWLYRKLLNRGISCTLLEKMSVGGVQSLASQGMIHGGQRYHLQGKRTQHGEDIAAMPALWARCFAGSDSINLSKVAVLSKNQYLWSPGGLTSGVTTFLASKAMNANVRRLENSELPEVFTGAKRFKGHVYEMDEWVVDVKSLVHTLASSSPCSDSIFKADVLHLKSNSAANPVLEISVEGRVLEIAARAVIYTAGLGNEMPIKDLKLDREKPRTQRRALKQIMVRGVEQRFYAHCITADPRPRMTITAHPSPDGTFVWYLGGIVAEYGLTKTDAQAIAFAKSELEALFPWLDWSNKGWACYVVDRAEPAFDGNFFKSAPEFICEQNIAVAWPTKLTFAPALASQLETWLDGLGLLNLGPTTEAQGWSNRPEIGNFPWEEAAWQS